VKVGITANPNLPGTPGLVRRIAKLCAGHEVMLEKEIALSVGQTGMALADMDADLLLAVGGDGTILRALQVSSAVLLGINSGSFGFLAEIVAEEVDTFVPRALRGDYRLEQRMRVKTTVDGRRQPDSLNEAVIHTAQVAKIRSFEVLVDGVTAERFRADGVIVATPTGSTSYAMSTGGPLVDPRMDAIIVTAIAPFKPSFHPFVFPAASEVRVRVTKPKECTLVLDGQREVPLTGSEDLTFTKSEAPAKFVRFRDDFYRRVSEKFARAE